MSLRIQRIFTITLTREIKKHTFLEPAYTCIWYPDCCHPDNCHPGKMPPDNYRLKQLPPRTIATQDNCHQDNSHLGQMPLRTIATLDNCHQDNSHLGQLPTRTTATYASRHPGKCHPRGVAGWEHVPTLFNVCNAMISFVMQ